MRIIGFTGLAGSGKNTAAGFLAAYLVDQGYTVTVDAFAAEIKREIRHALGWDGIKDAFWRKVLQLWGEQGRRTARLRWVDHIDRRQRSCDFLILTDVRYENEADWVRRNKGEIWRVTGRGGLGGETAKHNSETEQGGIEPVFEIINKGSLDELKEQVEEMFPFAFSLEKCREDSRD